MVWAKKPEAQLAVTLLEDNALAPRLLNTTSQAMYTVIATFVQCIQETTLDQVRQCVNRLITERKIPYVVKPFDQEFCEACCEEAARRGCPMEDAPGIRSIRPGLVVGVGMAIYTFGHLHDCPTQVYVALYIRGDPR
ncbi:hypothetical protein BDN71DRAFT_1446968 [Pleurotus eryngii]|uniref:Uncharacterized protein n=1 Tax=Pleurotus eryngii TaxID=5323 RepID=A0A9P6D904_PLEER|nr:hypothetical protein BDN71DRAFT_1446968 [Pleurotus eryngii]